MTRNLSGSTAGTDARTTPDGDRLRTDGGEEEGDTRHQGVEFGDLDEKLESIDYPVSLDELLAEHGDAELDLSGETRTLEKLLEPFEDDTYESADEVRQSILTMVDDEAIGRKNYSDRSGDDPGEETEEDDESF